MGAAAMQPEVAQPSWRDLYECSRTLGPVAKSCDSDWKLSRQPFFAGW